MMIVIILGLIVVSSVLSQQDPIRNKDHHESFLRLRKGCYIARLDQRKCDAPLCGGYFLKQTDGKTQCPTNKQNDKQSPTSKNDKQSPEECYVASLDYSRLRDDDQPKDDTILQHTICGYFQENQNDSTVFDFVVTKIKKHRPKCDCRKGNVCVDDPADDCVGCNCPTICQSSKGYMPCASDKSCPSGLQCIDNPDKRCTTECGDKDCDSICVEMHPSNALCGGIAGSQCPDGYTCYDDPNDSCNAKCGGADCGGFCGKNPVGQMCGGLAGIACANGLECVDPLYDDCDAACGGADCAGICLLKTGN